MDDDILQPRAEATSPSARHIEDLLLIWQEIHKTFCGWRGQIWRTVNGSDRALKRRARYSDGISVHMKYAHWQALFEICSPLSDAELDYLRVLAQQHFEFSAAMFRFNAVAFITLPISALVVINQLAPGWLSRFLKDTLGIFTTNQAGMIGSLTGYGIGLVSLLIGVALLFNRVYKARELRMALEIEAGRRRLLRGETLTSAGGDASDLQL